MVQIFDQAATVTDPALENLMKSLPDAVSEYMQEKQETTANSDLAEQLGIVDEDSKEAFRKLSRDLQQDILRKGYENRLNPNALNRETRLQKDSMNTEYNRAVKDINEGIRSGLIEDEKAAKRYIRDLRKEQALNSKGIVKGGPTSSESFQNYINIFSNGQAGPQGEAAPEPQANKPAFDSSNPDHARIRDEALQRSGGDRTKANELLMQMFN